MYEMTTTFKWKIGDRLTHIGLDAIPQPPPYPAAGNKDDLRAWRYLVAAGEREPVLVVTELLAQECPGGIQRFYLCRMPNLSGGLVQFHEEELRELTPPAPAAPGPAETPGGP